MPLPNTRFSIEILEPLVEGLNGFTWVNHLGQAADPDGTASGVNRSGHACGFGGAYWPEGVTTAAWCPSDPSLTRPRSTFGGDINNNGIIAGKDSDGIDDQVGGEKLLPVIWYTQGGGRALLPERRFLSGSPQTTDDKTLTISINDHDIVLARGLVTANRPLLVYPNLTWAVLQPASGHIGASAFKITERGDVTGVSVATGQIQHPAVWPGYSVNAVRLTLTSRFTNPTEGSSGCRNGNSKGQYVGKVLDNDAGEHPEGSGTVGNHRAVIWTSIDASPTSLGVIDSSFDDSDPTAINASGEVVGFCVDFGSTGDSSDNITRAFYWTRASGMWLLQDLISNMPAGATLISAQDISDNGRIVGAVSHEGLTKGFRLRRVA